MVEKKRDKLNNIVEEIVARQAVHSSDTSSFSALLRRCHCRLSVCLSVCLSLCPSLRPSSSSSVVVASVIRSTAFYVSFDPAAYLV